MKHGCPTCLDPQCGRFLNVAGSTCRPGSHPARPCRHDGVPCVRCGNTYTLYGIGPPWCGTSDAWYGYDAEDAADARARQLLEDRRPLDLSRGATQEQRDLMGVLTELLRSPGDVALRLIMADLLEDLMAGSRNPAAANLHLLREPRGWWEAEILSSVHWPDRRQLRWHGYRIAPPERYAYTPVPVAFTSLLGEGCKDPGHVDPAQTQGAYAAGAYDVHTRLTARPLTRWVWSCDACLDRRKKAWRRTKERRRTKGA